MNPWILLGFAIVIEVIGSNCIKASNGFTKPLPTVIAIAAFCGSVIFVIYYHQNTPAWDCLCGVVWRRHCAHHTGGNVFLRAKTRFT